MAATGRLTYDGVHTIAGTSALLHIMLLSVPARLGLPLELSDATLGVLFFALLIERTAAVAMLLTQSWEASLYAALATGLTGYMVFDALNGMETTLFMFLTMTCFGSLIKFISRGSGYLWPALWLYLTALARPEGFWFAGSLLLYLVVLAGCRREKIRQLATLSGCLVGAMLLAWATQWFVTGSVTPHTALAKVYFFSQFREPFRVRLMIYSRGVELIWGPVILLLLPLLWTQKARPLLVTVLPWMVTTQILFLMLLPNEVSAYQGRYVHPLMPFLFILAGDGVNALLHSTGKYRIPRWATAIVLACIALVCYFNLVTMLANYENEKVAVRNNNIWAVKWLQANAPPGIRVATHDIGALRYFGHYELVDVSGLTDEEAMARNRTESGQLAYLAGKRPDYLVGDDRWLGNLLHYFPGLRRWTTPVAVAHPNAFRALKLSIYRCHWDQAGEGLRETENSSCLR
jgi:hypothetical protein